MASVGASKNPWPCNDIINWSFSGNPSFLIVLQSRAYAVSLNFIAGVAPMHVCEARTVHCRNNLILSTSYQLKAPPKRGF